MTFSDFDKATAATPTAFFDRLAAVLPGAVDKAMRGKALPDLYTPEKARELAEDIFLRLRQLYTDKATEVTL
ncbi:hypothetical protein KMT30_00085 [Streptomyces sp. IBSBF 2953]|uniref:hypothetical protein n=1 Tax=Streptomyces TaxID=1883 RepID=UPI00211A2B85|nr:hypothetical protein [Streptomyces scabiei]MCQ9177483.1 hypothetical protein [Streptomyces hayashii]MDX3111888.1 hypothetical protein [Streptomyces scabiei]